MANRITKEVLSEGPSKMVVQWILEADGEGDLTNYQLLDPAADLNPNQGTWTQMSISQIWFSNVWFDVVLSFNALNPMKTWALARDGAFYHDFRYFGGLRDYSDLDHDGKLLISTNGFDVPGSVGSLVLELRKNNVSNPSEYQSGNKP